MTDKLDIVGIGNAMVDAIIPSNKGEVEKNNLPGIITVMSKYNIHYEEIGETTDHQAMVFGNEIYMPISKAKDGWKKALRNKIK